MYVSRTRRLYFTFRPINSSSHGLFSKFTVGHLLENCQSWNQFYADPDASNYFISATTSLPLPAVRKSFKFVNARTSILRCVS